MGCHIEHSGRIRERRRPHVRQLDRLADQSMPVRLAHSVQPRRRLVVVVRMRQQRAPVSECNHDRARPRQPLLDDLVRSHLAMLVWPRHGHPKLATHWHLPVKYLFLWRFISF